MFIVVFITDVISDVIISISTIITLSHRLEYHFDINIT